MMKKKNLEKTGKKETLWVYLYQIESVPGSLANNLASATLLRLQINLINRSIPIPHPAEGGIPFFTSSRYHLREFSSFPLNFIREIILSYWYSLSPPERASPNPYG